MSKNIVVKKLARVEGNGGITVSIENNKVKDVRVNIYEGPRLIEAIVVGKTPEEDLTIVPRICAICTISHKYAALRGLEKALDVKVPEKVQLFRTLMHFGEMIESHTLHVFLLALPDFLGYPSAIAMVDKFGDEVTKGLLLKKYANKIMRLAGGDRMIHGSNQIIGGFGKFPSKEVLLELKEEAKKLIPYAERGIEVMGSVEIEDYPATDTIFMCLNPPDGKYGFVGDTVLISTGEEVSVDEYKKLTNERVVPHSFAKRSTYQGKPFSVGAQARILLLKDRLTGKAKKYFEKYYNEQWHTNPLYNNMAQAIETLYCLEEIPKIIDRMIKLKDPEVAKPNRTTGSGTGAVEAPRGILYHYYDIKDGLIQKADIITPTAQNLDDIERHIRIGAENLLAKKENDQNITLKLEMVARAYDPCISCSAHMVRIKRS